MHTDERAHLVAVGTMQPGIEIWNLNVLEPFDPVATLGGFVEPRRAISAAAAESAAAPIPAGTAEGAASDEDGAAEAASTVPAKSKKDRLKEKKKAKKKVQRHAGTSCPRYV